MPLPINFPPFIYGIHDPGTWMDRVQGVGRQGWVLYTEELRENSSGNNYLASEQRGFGVLARLNWGYGDAGTIPAPARYGEFADHCRRWVANSKGGHIWIIGNEMNLAAEWPGGPAEPNKITPTMYADCFARCRTAIRSAPGHENDLVVTGAVAPYNNQTAYPSNPTGDWIRYFQDLLGLLGSNLDGISLHSYTHGPQAGLIANEAKMSPPFDNRNYHFRAYRDFLQAVPAAQRGLPVFITEAQPAPQAPDPCHNGGWLPAETRGWVPAAYKEINDWNAAAGNQPIQALVLFRWDQGCDSWSIQDKDTIVGDFYASLNAGYRVVPPAGAPAKTYRATFMSDNVPVMFAADAEVPVTVSVRNDGNFVWLADGASTTPVRIGFRWFDTAGREIPARDGPRTALPRNIAPGETVSIANVRVIAPPASGTYVLRLDMLEEGATWFADTGSAPRNVTVSVRSPASSSPASAYGYTVISSKIPDSFARDAGVAAVLSLRNDGYKVWRATGPNPVTLGYKWFRPGAAQETLVRQLIRANLPRDVATGDSATVSVNVLAPFSPGAYSLVFDLVEEGVTEFRAAGAQPFSKAVTVSAPPYYATWNSATVPATLKIDQTVSVTVNVRNDGGKTWSAAGANPVRLFYNWFDRRSQRVLVRQDIRVAVPKDVAPGEAIDLTIDLLAPDRPGKLSVRFDMVEEGVTSFEDQGSPALAKSVTVLGIQDYQVTFGDVQPVVAPSAPFVFNLRLRNDGLRTWAAGGASPVKLGYHWFDGKNQPVPVAQDIRTPLPADMLPGDELVVQATGFAPESPGRYRLQWSLVAEGLAWFYDLKGRTFDVAVEVAQIGAPLPKAMADLPPPAADTAYRAAFTPVDFVVAAEAGAQRVVTFRVRNDGTRAWPKSGANPVHAGYRWFQGGALVPVAMDVRTELPGDLGPGQEAIFGVTVVVPEVPDIYDLWLDLVEEGVTWFADTGTSLPLTFAVRVTDAPAATRVSAAPTLAALAPHSESETRRWQVSGPGAPETWAQADLGAMRSLDALSVQLDRAIDARIEASTDGVAWSVLERAVGRSAIVAAFAPHAARFVRVVREGAPSDNQPPAITALLVHDALPWQAIASHNRERAALAYDNDRQTVWSSGDNQQTGMQFTLDLGRVQTVSGVSLDNGDQPDYPGGFLIQVSADGQQWTVVAASPDSGNLGPVDVTFDGQQARYISVECTANRSRPWTIAEFRVRRVITDWNSVRPDA